MKETASRIRQHIAIRQQKLGLTFEEEAHKYTIRNSQGIYVHPPSVSKIVKNYYEGFDEQSKSLDMAGGDLIEQLRLLNEWKEKRRIGAHIGSRCHYYLEHNLVTYFGLDKVLRKPEYDVQGEDLRISDAKIVAGNKYIDLMISRGAMLVDTEVVMGNEHFVGQLDKVWLIMTKSGQVGWFITDWKSTKHASFQKQRWTKKMLWPFHQFDDTSFGTYSLQLALYARLFKEMLAGSEFENIPFLGSVIVILKPDESFEELKVPNEMYPLVGNLNLAA